MTDRGIVPDSLLHRLKDSPEPAARWVYFAEIRHEPAGAAARAARAAVLADPLTSALLDRLAPWDVENPVSGHNRPEYAPNLLTLLFDMGVAPGDDPRIENIMRCMLDHQAPDGRFLACGRVGRGQAQEQARWAALPCDSHAILEVLARAGYADDPRVRRAFATVAADLGTTAQGAGWRCLPDPQVKFRGPGRSGDCCPQVTLEALRAFSYLPEAARPPAIVEAAHTILGIWRNRATERPYMFGHGRSFKRVKWPATWYSAFAVVDTIGRFPEVWDRPGVARKDRRALAELAACLLAYNVGPGGKVVPRSIFTGYGRYTFGQKKLPSDFAAARIALALSRLELLAADVAAIDVLALASSKGGSGTVLPP